MMITREQILQEIKRDGIEAIKSRVNQMNPKKCTRYKEVISEIEFDQSLSRQESREDESLSISRRALVISEDARDSARSANKIAIAAMILSAAIAIIIAIIEFKSKAP
jgi:hypothetical protein